MHLTHLSLTNYRNYAKQELALAPGNVLLLGDNAHGKTNLLEAVFLLATGRAERAATDAEVIAWAVRDDPQPYARVAGVAHRNSSARGAQAPPPVHATSGEISVEVTIIGRPGARGGLVASKRLKLNGVPKRAADVAGAITAVLFTTDDMDLVRGAPAGRRRYLDVMLSQAGRDYARALSRYTKVVTQRNALLRRIQEGAGAAGELDYWDGELARDGGALLVERAAAVERLACAAAALHARLSGGRERFAVAYDARTLDGWPPAHIAAAPPAEAPAGGAAAIRLGGQPSSVRGS